MPGTPASVKTIRGGLLGDRPLERNEMPDQQMLEERQKTWNVFVKLMTWSTAAMAIILLLMLIFLV